MIGQIVGHYRIVSQLGAGGMGTVYRAEDQQLQRSVAIKFVSTHLSRSPQAHQRLLREARNASALDHPHIGVVHEVAETSEGQLYIVMSLYEGGTLRQRQDQGLLAVEEALRLARQITEGLAAAHAAGIVHRDLKPENILLTRDGQVRIVDFGLAVSHGETRMLQAGSGSGSVAYMSPEQALGQEVDARGDLFSLGVILYEMLGGRPPFRGDSDSAVLYQVVHEEPPTLEGLRSGVPKPLRQLVARLLVKDPAGRYQDAAAVLEDLGRGRVRRRWPRRQALLVAAATVAILGITTWWAWPRYLSETARFKRELVRLQSDQRPLVIAVAPFTTTGFAAEARAAILRGVCAQELNRLLAGDQHVQLMEAESTDIVRNEREARALAKRLYADVVLWGELVALGDSVAFQPFVTAMPRVLLSGSSIFGEMPSSQIDASPKESLRADADVMRSFAALVAASYHTLQNEKARALDLLRGIHGGGLQVQLQKASLLKDLGALEDAVACSEHLANLYPQSAEAHSDYGWNLHDRTDDKAAIEEFKIALDLDPHFHQAALGMGWAYVWLGREADAKAPFQRVADSAHDDNPSALRSRGDALVWLGRYEDGLSCLRRATELDPYRVASRLTLCRTYMYLGRYDEALREIDIALLITPQNSGAMSRRAAVLISAGRLHEAESYIAANREAMTSVGFQYELQAFRLALLTRDFVSAGRSVRAQMESRVDPHLVASRLWLVVFATRGPEAAQDELRKFLATIPGNPEDKFAPMTRFLLGEMTESELAEFGSGEDPMVHAKRTCAYLYALGMRHVLVAESGEPGSEAERAVAIACFEKSVATGVRSLFAHADAMLELKRLKGQKLE